MKHGKSKLSLVERELHKIEREEEKLTQNAKKQDSSPGWKSKLEGKMPAKTLAAALSENGEGGFDNIHRLEWAGLRWRRLASSYTVP